MAREEAPPGSSADPCMWPSWWSVGTSPSASACRSAVGPPRTCVRLAPACSGLSRLERANLDWPRQKEHTRSFIIHQWYILFSLTLIKYQKWDRTEYFLLHKSHTSFGERMEMKSSYIWRTFSSTTLLLVSFFSSSHASQNIMFSSLNSVRRNCLKQPRPAALFITFSNDDDQERASSSVGRRLGGIRVTSQSYFIHSAHPGLTQHPAEIFHYLSSQFMVPSDRCSQVDLWTASSSLLTVRLRGKMHLMHSTIHFII